MTKMASKSQRRAYTEMAPQECESGPVSYVGRSNSDMLAKLAPQPAGAAPVELGEVEDGGSFASAAGAALDAALPGEGAFASLKVAAKVPFYSTGAAQAFAELGASLQANRTQEGGLEVTMALQLGLRGELGTRWWGAFVAYARGYMKGSLKLVGDSGEEIFQQVLLALAEAFALAAEQANLSPELADEMRQGLTGGAYARFAKGVDEGDSLTVGLGGGVEAGAKAGGWDGSVGAELMFTRRFTNEDGDRDLEASDAQSLTLTSQLNLATLGLTVPANVTLVWKDGALDEWFLGMGVTRKLPLGDFTKEALGGAAWAAGFANGVANLVASAGAKAKLDVSETAQLLRAISPVEEAMTYSATAGMLKSAAGQPWFQEKSGQEVSFALDGQAGWSADKGANLRVALSTAETWTLGEEGVTPLFIEARTGDTLVSFEDAAQGGQRGGT